MTAPRLSICIPTFNRASALDQCLRSVVPQCEQVGAEICISDNASEDRTSDVIADWQSRYDRIRVNHHSQNLRIDRNIAACAKLATGDVIWFLSDDDILEDRAVETVLSLVDRHPAVATFIVNRREYDSGLMLPVHDVKPLTRLADSDGEAVVSIEDGLVELGEYLGYLPAWVIRREAWTKLQPDKFLDTDFVHVGVGLAGTHLWAQATGGARRLVVLNRALIRCRLARASWRNRHYEVWIRNWQKTMKELEPYVAPEALMSVTALVTQRNYLSIVSGRGFGPYGISDYLMYFRANTPSLIKRIIAIVVAFAPRWSARVFTRFQRGVREALAN